MYYDFTVDTKDRKNYFYLYKEDSIRKGIYLDPVIGQGYVGEIYVEFHKVRVKDKVNGELYYLTLDCSDKLVDKYLFSSPNENNIFNMGHKVKVNLKVNDNVEIYLYSQDGLRVKEHIVKVQFKVEHEDEKFSLKYNFYPNACQ
ncbi:MAG: hypothetical protein N4A57_14565 [Anaeromicrobium sp.]|jgi:hypothetical protein|uniref:hypothetical protein n=1 Tax=Anaeromicrobium sp. TaxID=1929132 RepID=UPI0025F3A528|nr:hypothetical protein [Anaeromicrobium sp.]MCT4595469.1 hypothetical protein [Anaeromicrobium sp.]